MKVVFENEKIKSMDFKLKLFLGFFALILTITLIILWINTEKKEYQPGISEEFDKAVNQAQLVYRQSVKRGDDLESGPCLTNALLPGWVVDIAHNPRTPEDDLSSNQCKAYLEGTAKHFVELDVDGNVIRVR